jgi:gamma-glutamylcyclotransferase (GGCT)/AIG2-like uncharacterized protein YtfP
MAEHLVFVYGTLRKGGVRAMPLVAPTCLDYGEAQLYGRLFDLGAFPGLRIDPTGSVVHGELYGVDDATLDRLDDIEQYFPERPNESYYVRLRVEVTNNGENVGCWTYEFNPLLIDAGPQIDSGDWISYFAAKVDVPEERWPDGKFIEK